MLGGVEGTGEIVGADRLPNNVRRSASMELDSFGRLLGDCVN